MTTPTITARIALSTVATPLQASTIARTLVEEQLAACVNILPAVRSIYRWQGAIQDDPEYMLLIKTTAEKLAQMEARLKALHPYEVPEFLVLVPSAASQEYLSWIDQCLS